MPVVYRNDTVLQCDFIAPQQTPSQCLCFFIVVHTTHRMHLIIVFGWWLCVAVSSFAWVKHATDYWLATNWVSNIVAQQQLKCDKQVANFSLNASATLRAITAYDLIYKLHKLQMSTRVVLIGGYFHTNDDELRTKFASFFFIFPWPSMNRRTVSRFSDCEKYE